MTDIPTGAVSTVVSPAALGGGLAIYDLGWAPDGRAIAFTLTDDPAASRTGLPGATTRGLPGLWVVDVGGSIPQHVSTIGTGSLGAPQAIAWRPAFR